MKIAVITEENGNETEHVYDEMGKVSDGYHTFDELYEHRILLFIALMKSHPKLSWWSRKHADGSEWEGWIIAGMHLPTGDITYHLNSFYGDEFLTEIEELDKAPEWDGHTAADVVKRLEMWTVDPCERDE